MIRTAQQEQGETNRVEEVCKEWGGEREEEKMWIKVRQEKRTRERKLRSRYLTGHETFFFNTKLHALSFFFLFCMQFRRTIFFVCVYLGA